jgi:predicted  nucleic acid-binding Zn-ribbon protein
LQKGLEQAAQKEHESLIELRKLDHIQKSYCKVILSLQEEYRSLKDQATKKDHKITALQVFQSWLNNSYRAQCEEALRLREEIKSLREDATRKEQEIAEL